MIAGRKRKFRGTDLVAVRRPTEPWELRERQRDGRYKRETQAEIQAAMINVRLRLGVPVEMCRDQMAGTQLGRLCIQKTISPEQYASGIRFGEVVGRYRAIMLPAQVRGVKSPSTGSVGGSSGISEEDMSEEDINRRRRDYDDMFCALNDCQDGKEYLRALKICILMDQPCNTGDLRCGLNVLTRLWR
jgi:hypothetical protein